jgi:hypothetical protein
MSLKPSRRGLLIGMGATAADAVLPVQANTRDDPMAYRAAAELVEALAKRRVSSRELVDSAIARIEALDSKINAVVVRDFDRARAAAITNSPIGTPMIAFVQRLCNSILETTH